MNQFIPKVSLSLSTEVDWMKEVHLSNTLNSVDNGGKIIELYKAERYKESLTASLSENFVKNLFRLRLKFRNLVEEDLIEKTGKRL